MDEFEFFETLPQKFRIFVLPRRYNSKEPRANLPVSLLFAGLIRVCLYLFLEGFQRFRKIFCP